MLPSRNWTDQKIEIIIAHLLRAGVLLSATVVMAGACMYLLRHGRTPVDYRVFRGEPAHLRDIRGIVADSIALRSEGIIQLGLLLLIATPVARVAFSIFGFAREKDNLYVAVASLVLLILLYGLFGS
jgi:uncharacterized membrane protein